MPIEIWRRSLCLEVRVLNAKVVHTLPSNRMQNAISSSFIALEKLIEPSSKLSGPDANVSRLPVHRRKEGLNSPGFLQSILIH